MMNLRYRFLLTIFLLAASAFAQEFRATLTGRVADQQNLAIVDATVDARNVSTNEVSSAKTDSRGDFSIPFLRPGTYTVSVKRAGFKEHAQEGITLQVAQTASLAIQLQVGATSESVTVTSEAPLLENATADRGGVVDSQRVAELPLNARNPFMLGAMMSGVTFRGESIWQRPFDNGAIAHWSINGSRQQQNEFLLDGAPNNSQAGSNNIAYVPIVDAVQEFKMQSNTYDAQYGHTAGGIMNVVLKSGGNQFHGSGWEFMRRKWLDANSYQNKAIGAPRPGHYLDQYGLQLSGPVIIPKLYNGHDKTFFLVSVENYSEGTPQPLKLSVPAPEFLNGDFSNLRKSDGSLITLYNPFSDPNGAARTQFQCDAAGNPLAPDASFRQPAGIPCNKIPQQMINPVARKILSYFPKPNFVTPSSAYSQNNFVLPGYFAKDTYYNYLARLDQVIGQKHRVFFRFGRNDRTEERNTNGVLTGPGQDGQQPFHRPNWTGVVDWVGTFSPTFVANVRFSYNRFIEQGFGRGDLGFDLTSLGFPAATVNQLPGGGGRFFGRYEFDGYAPLGRFRDVNITDNFALNPNVTKIWKAHTIHTGVDMRRIYYMTQSTGNVWRFTNNRNFTRLNKDVDDGSGNTIANFLLGIPSGGSSDYANYPFFRQWYFAPFAQDDWKVTRRLTVNVGLRWDFTFAPDDKNNKLDYRFDPNAQADPTRFPELANYRGGLTFAGVNGNPTRSAHRPLWNIQPRIGMAYQVMQHLVVRAGWGRFYANPSNNWQKTTGFSTSTPLVSSNNSGRTPIPNVLSNPFPSGILTPTGSSLGAATFVGKDFSWFEPNFKTPLTDQFSFGFQLELPKSSMLEVSYVGSRGRNLETERAYNIPSLDFRRQCNPLEGGTPAYCNQLLPNPFLQKPAFLGTSFYTAPTITRFQLARPFPQFSGDLLRQGLNTAATWYNALEVDYNVRWKNSLNLLANYTFSKLMERWGYNDPYRGIMQQGLYYADRPHVFKVTAVYQLPIGRGRLLAANAGRLLDQFIGGWETTTFFTAQSGEPADLPNTGGQNLRILRDPKLTPHWKDAKVFGFRPCIFQYANENDPSKGYKALAVSDAYGCGKDFSTFNFFLLPSYAPREGPYRSPIRMYHTITMDSSLDKTFPLTERFKLQARFEAFNVLNHYSFPLARFGTNPFASDNSFGTLQPALISPQNSGYPRQLQLGVKLLW